LVSLYFCKTFGKRLNLSNHFLIKFLRMKSLAFVLLSSTIFLFSSAFVNFSGEKSEVLLTCNVTACNKVDSLYLFEFNGVNFKKTMAAPTADWQTYQFKMPATTPRFYYIGMDVNNAKPIILGTEEKVTLNGTCAQFQGAQLPDSDLNIKYEELKNLINQHKNELSQYLRQLQAANAQENIELANETVRSLAGLDQRRLELLESLKKTNPYLAKILALNTYLSYQNHGSGDMNEIEYFAANYFQLVDWNDTDYNHMPWVYESIKSYAQTLASVNLPDANQKNYIDQLLNKIPANSRTYMLALGGVISGLESKKSPLISNYAQRYVDLYKKSEPEAAAQLQQVLQMSASFITGAQAPDFSMNDPEGKPVKLSDFRGKVLLIDFWASWCGPCRRENPHVVELYNHYNKKGFDILGVSLDRTREPWLAAIEKDGLLWHHVSDLQGWSNSAARLYGVSSIPHTVLLDKEGKILARNLRGEALTAKLRELFGE
jgi:thiol-disulfide isomerase/thioredoxin